MRDFYDTWNASHIEWLDKFDSELSTSATLPLVERYLVFGLVGMLAACAKGEQRSDTDARTTDAAGSNMTLRDAATSDAARDAASGTCGNGMMDSGEACDDNNMASSDGCSSACALEVTQTVTMTGLNLSIVDDGYNGTLASMACANVAVTAWYTPAIASASVILGVDHTWVGDLVIKAIAPDNTTVTLASRPGLTEAADDGATAGGFGTGADLSKSFPITFVTGAAASAESMGVGIGVVCQTDNVCQFAPNSGAATAGTLAAFNGKPSTGTWKLCIGDSTAGDPGKIDRVTLTFGH